MKSVLLISFSEASSPRSKEVNYRTVSEKKMQIPRLMGFPSKKRNDQADLKAEDVEIIVWGHCRRELQLNTVIACTLPPFNQQLQIL